MFAVIRHYHFNPKDGAEIDRRIREEFVPIIKNAKGFVRYYWLDTGDGEGASLRTPTRAIVPRRPNAEATTGNSSPKR